MAGMTKDELKNALVTHGVDSNFATLKKDELVALYEEFVAPHDLGDFSSDDEAVITPTKKASRASAKSVKSNKSTKSTKSNGEKKELTEENSLTVGDINVDELSDEKLALLLKEHGVDVGPIVGKYFMQKIFVTNRSMLFLNNLLDFLIKSGCIECRHYSLKRIRFDLHKFKFINSYINENVIIILI